MLLLGIAKSPTLTVILSIAKDLLTGNTLCAQSLVGLEEILHFVQNDNAWCRHCEEGYARRGNLCRSDVILSVTKDPLAGNTLCAWSLVGFEEILHFVQNDNAWCRHCEEGYARRGNLCRSDVILSIAKDPLAGNILCAWSLVGFEEILHSVQNDNAWCRHCEEGCARRGNLCRSDVILSVTKDPLVSNALCM